MQHHISYQQSERDCQNRYQLDKIHRVNGTIDLDNS